MSGGERAGERREKKIGRGEGEKMDVLSFNLFLRRWEAEAEERGEDVGWAFEEEKSERTRTFTPFFFAQGKGFTEKVCF